MADNKPLDENEWIKQHLLSQFDVGGDWYSPKKDRKKANSGAIDTAYEQRQVEKYKKKLANQGTNLHQMWLDYRANWRDDSVTEVDVDNAKTMILAQIEAEKASQALTEKVVSGNFPLIMIGVVVIVGFIMFK